MFRKVLHIVLLIILVTTPVINAYSAMSMQSFSNTPASLVTTTDPASLSNHHHIHSASANAANEDEAIGFDSQTKENIKIASSYSQACCLDCDTQCDQNCLVYIVQPQTLFFEHSFNTFISFMAYPYSLIPANLPDRPPNLS